MNGRINLERKATGKPSAGNRHAGFDEAGAGNVPRGAGLRPGAKAPDEPPDPTGGAPAPDPTHLPLLGFLTFDRESEQYLCASLLRHGKAVASEDRWRLGALARQPIASSPRFRRADRACHFQLLRGARSWAAVAGATAAALGRSAAVRFSIGASDRFSVRAVRFGLNRRPLSIEAHGAMPLRCRPTPIRGERRIGSVRHRIVITHRPRQGCA